MSELKALKVRGVALEGTTAALKPAFRQSQDVLPKALWPYMEREIQPEQWYPAEDYLALLRVLASFMDVEKSKGDVYRAIGIIGARRDVRGVQETVPRTQRHASSGAFQEAFAGAIGLPAKVRCALRLRESYYSRGFYRVTRAGERRLLVTLHDFPAVREFCSISTGFMIEVFRTACPGTWVERLSCRGEGDADCRWELRFSDEKNVTGFAAFE